jgi:hypothetical protein
LKDSSSPERQLWPKDFGLILEKVISKPSLECSFTEIGLFDMGSGVNFTNIL